MPEINKRRTESQDAFVTLTCPICGTNTKALKDDPPSLPDECAVCIERLTQGQVDALEADQPSGASQREIAALQANVAKLQGEQRKQGAEMLAMRGDLADIRRMMQELVREVGTPAPAAVLHSSKGRKTKGR